jgi:hypothetical protein
MIPSEPARLTPTPAEKSAAVLTLARDVDIRLSTGYRRTLPAGSGWQSVGSLPQGTVYRRAGDIFSIEGRHVHEAYLVVNGAALQGFYLPGEASYSPLTPSVSLPLGAP